MDFAAHLEMDKRMVMTDIALLGQHVAGAYAEAVEALVTEGRIVRKARSRREIYVAVAK